jgi:hypothetical protein
VSLIEIPTGADDLTPGWLTSVLRGSFDGRVTAVDKTPVGTGQIADSVRVALTWDPPGAGPASIVCKVTTASETSKRAAMATRTYEVEVGFYNHLAPTVAVRCPQCWWAGHDPATGAYGVVLEDLAPAVQGDQVAGCSVDDAALALDEAALLHGSRWADEKLFSLPWLGNTGATGGGMANFVSAVLPGFLDRYGDRLSPDVVALCQRFAPKASGYGIVEDQPRTVVHGDFRNDNLMFGLERVCVLDWQTVSIGHALSDVSYFLGGSLLPDDRAKHEGDLVRQYVDRLRATGVDIAWDDAWRGYRRFAFGGMVMAIIASMLVTRTDRGDDMFVAMADRGGRHAIDLDAESLIHVDD